MAMWPSDMFSQFVQMRRRSTRCVCGTEDHTAPSLTLFVRCQKVWWDCPRSQSLTMDRNMLEKGRICNFEYLMSTFLNNWLLKPDDASMHHQVPKCIWITINPFDCKLYLPSEKNDAVMKKIFIIVIVISNYGNAIWNTATGWHCLFFIYVNKTARCQCYP